MQKIKIALIDSNTSQLFVTDVPEISIINEEGDYCDTLIAEFFSKEFDECFSESEITWGTINKINIK